MASSDLTTAELLARLGADERFTAAWHLHEPKVTLAANLSRLRHQRGLTQQQLAAAAGMRQPRIAELEQGLGNPQLETLARIASALGTEISDLLVRETPSSSHLTVKVQPVRFDAGDPGLDVEWDERAGSAVARRTRAADGRFALGV